MTILAIFAVLSPLAALGAGGDPMVLGKEALRQKNFKQAVEQFEKAAAADPRSSNAQLWLGRAYGRLAENSSFLTAPRHASRCRQAFEKAVELDDRNIEAWNDLFSYYLEAPGFLGGGTDKAEKAAGTIASLSEVEGHYARAQLAKKKKDWETAERELRRAAEMAPKEPGRQVDLALLLAERGNRAGSEAAFAQAAAIDPNHPGFLYERARLLISQKRDFAEARRLLERYLQVETDADDPAPADARKLLSQIPK